MESDTILPEQQLKAGYCLFKTTIHSVSSPRSLLFSFLATACLSLSPPAQTLTLRQFECKGLFFFPLLFFFSSHPHAAADLSSDAGELLSALRGRRGISKEVRSS